MSDHQLASIIWDYMKMNLPLKQVDAIIVLGSHDEKVPIVAADLFKKGFSNLVICTGGLGSITKHTQSQTEAEKFSQIMIKQDVPSENILLEKESTNTGDNFLKTKALLGSKNIFIKSAIVVTKPYMERRAFATGKKVWPELEIIPSCEEISFEEYLIASPLKEKVIDVLLGDLQRIDVYGQNGFQISQEIPQQVRVAFEELAARGYNSRLLK